MLPVTAVLLIISTIELESKATGILSTGTAWEGETPENPRKFGALVAPSVYAPIHTHTFAARLDMAVDGIDNSVYEVGDIAGVLLCARSAWDLCLRACVRACLCCALCR